MSETFGLTGVDIEEREPAPVQPSRARILSENGASTQSAGHIKKALPIPLPPAKARTDKLPRLNLPKNAMRIRSQSTLNVASALSEGPKTHRKIDGLKSVLDATVNVKTNTTQSAGGGGGSSLTTALSSGAKVRAPPKSSRSFLDVYQSKIQADFDKLYSTRDYTQILKQVRGLEKKAVMQEQIERGETFVQREMNLYNQIGYEQRVKERRLVALQQQIQDVERAAQPPEGIDELDAKRAVLSDLQQRVSDAQYEQETFEWMEESRRELVTFIKKQCQKLLTHRQDLAADLALQSGFYSKYFDARAVGDLQDRLDRLRAERDAKSNFQSARMPEKFEERLEGELEHFENKKAMDEIFRHEERIRREREEERRRERAAELRRAKAEQEAADRELQREHKHVDKRLQREAERFQELRRVTQVSTVDQLFAHRAYLIEGKDELTRFENEYKRRIQEDRDEIVRLQARRRDLLYGQGAVAIASMQSIGEEVEDQQQKQQNDARKDNSSNNNNNNNDDESLLKKIEELEAERANADNVLHDISKSITKKRACVDQMCLAMSRILFQLQNRQDRDKGVDVKRKDLGELVNMASLMLERINGLLARRQAAGSTGGGGAIGGGSGSGSSSITPGEGLNGAAGTSGGVDYVRVESVNTGSNHDAPPAYLGLSARRVPYVQYEASDYENHAGADSLSRSESRLDTFGVNNEDSQSISDIRNEIKGAQ